MSRKILLKKLGVCLLLSDPCVFCMYPSMVKKIEVVAEFSDFINFFNWARGR